MPVKNTPKVVEEEPDPALVRFQARVRKCLLGKTLESIWYSGGDRNEIMLVFHDTSSFTIAASGEGTLSLDVSAPRRKRKPRIPKVTVH